MTSPRCQIVIVDEDSAHLEGVVESLLPHHDAIGIESATLFFEQKAFEDINLLLVSTGLTDTHFASLVADVHKKWPGLPIILMYHDDASYVRMSEHYGKLATAALRKPVDACELKELVASTLLTKPFSILTDNNRNLTTT